MANYNYDEGGNLAAYFVITFLALVLVPLTFSLVPSKKQQATKGCQCTPCLEQRARNAIREKGSWLRPGLSTKGTITFLGWGIMVLLCYKVYGAKSEATFYNPLDILGIKAGATEKEIKSHYKRLALKFHPDKVKLAVNQTIEEASSYYVELTKAYKSLTDPIIRQNLEEWGHPDGRQETTSGIALPKWIIEGKNNIWVLGVYGLLFGGALPALVGRWWFGTSKKTKDGVSPQTASSFFKSLKEESTLNEVVAVLSSAYNWDLLDVTKNISTQQKTELQALEKQIDEQLGSAWRDVKKFSVNSKTSESRLTALTLLYAHLLRLPIQASSLKKAQTTILLQTPTLLNALLTISTSRNWLAPSLAIMRLSSFITQAIVPGQTKARWAQLPNVSGKEATEKLPATELVELEDVLARLSGKSGSGDKGRLEDVNKAASSWGRLDLVDVTYKVIDERIVVPSSIVYLVVKLRLLPPSAAKEQEEDVSIDEMKRRVKVADKRDSEFLESRKDAESIETLSGWAHAPHWPGNRKPSWWLVLADDKSNKVVIPPIKLSDVPFADPSQPDGLDYRSYKVQFQAPNSTGLFTWKVYLISDTFVGEEVTKDMPLRIEDASLLTADERGAEDEISEPDEDSLAGQMAMMKGGKVKKVAEDDEDSDEDESDTDGDSSSESTSESD